ncbi:glyoxalase superfamily protein [Actinoplanes sp. NPDC026623]|uniref:glyoxalase superfamily protein n=1 Tax=Actinoplanes sp. NPDC026623 TaxID=3155610 RepID=UPI0033E0B391
MVRYARLGFAKQWEHRFEPGFPLFVCVLRGLMQLYLSEHREDARPDTLLYLHVGDVDAVAAEFGAAIEETPWGREVHLKRPGWKPSPCRQRSALIASVGQ